MLPMLSLSPWWRRILRSKKDISYHIVGNFEGRKPSRISQFYSHLWEFSPWNFRQATPIYVIGFTFHESFLDAPFLLIRENFLPLKISHYTVFASYSSDRMVQSYVRLLKYSNEIIQTIYHRVISRFHVNFDFQSINWSAACMMSQLLCHSKFLTFQNLFSRHPTYQCKGSPLYGVVA